MAPIHEGVPLPHDSHAERMLLFRLDGVLHGIRVAEVGGVAHGETLHELPGAHPAVLGLAEWRGQVLAVLDLPGLLGRSARPGPTCLVRLGPPLEHTALQVPTRVLLSEDPPERLTGAAGEGTGGGWICGGERLHLVDPAAIVRQLEAQMREES